MEHDLTFQQIKDRVEMPEMLAHYGYELKKGENLNKGKWHVFKGDDTLVVFKGRGNDWMYFNAEDDRDKGSVVDWMRNRVSTGRIVGIEQKPGRNLWQSVNDNFREYLNLPESQRVKLNLEPITPLAPGEKFTNIVTQNCRPLEDTTFLESRGITKSTLENPQFAGRILNQFHTVQKEGMPAKTYVNTAFPARYEDRVVALELKGAGFKGQAPESDFSRSLWLSKKPEGKPATQLVVSESAIDTLSYAQLNPNDRAIYASTSGNLTQNKIFEMKRIMTAENLSGIKSLFDNDTEGHHFDTRLLAGFASEKNPMKVVRENKHLLSVEIIGNSPALQAMHDKLKAFNTQTTKQYQEASGASPGPGGGTQPQMVPTLAEQLIGGSRQSQNTWQFHLPMSKDALSAFNQAALQHLSFEKKVELVKSHSKDWNQDLKEQQMQQVVAKEFPQREQKAGTAEDNRTVFEAIAWDGKLPQETNLQKFQREATEAREKGERLVRVDFRDDRREVSQLPSLRDNLEKAGLTIVHAINEPGLNQPGVGQPSVNETKITLSYPINSDKLPTISQALNALATNPKASIVEPAQDATERRQLAAAQETAAEQKRQAAPQIQPSDSPAHDQARLTFVTAAGPLVKQLREVDTGEAKLAAQHIVDVSRFLLKQPELRTSDKENINKVMGVVDKHPAIKESVAVQQLKQAVDVVSKPVGAPELKQAADTKQSPPREETPTEERKSRGLRR
jgi:hypothetical protein